jgi:hypothetical protein
MKVAAEHVFTGTTQSIASYDSTKTLLGTLLRQYTGATSADKYVSAIKSAQVNNVEIAGTSLFAPFVYQRSSTIFWIFMPTNATAAATRVIGFYEFDSSVSSLTWKGYITLSGTTFAGNKIIRGFRAFVTKHYDGTVSTTGSSTTIEGIGTKFTDDRIAVGARIGFGTTDPTAVTSWYEITAITDNDTLVISAPVNLSAGTSYVIEEIRILLSTTNVTLYNGGVFLIKGLNESTFSLAGTTIPEATTVDNIRASYFLRDSVQQGTFTVTIATPGVFTKNGHGLIANDIVAFSTTGALPTGLTANTLYYVIATDLTADTFKVSASQGGAAVNTSGTQSGTHTLYSANTAVGTGLASDDAISATEHYVYALNLDTATTVRFLKFNVRASLTVSGGLSYSAFVNKTGLSTITGTASQVNNGRLFTVNHGSALGEKSVWFTTTTRIYRVAVANLVETAANVLSDFMLEIPPGTATTHILTNTINQVDYANTLDRLILPTTSLRLGAYVSQYDPTSSTPADKIFGTNLNRYKLTTTSPDAPIALYPQATQTIWTEGGFLFSAPAVVTSGLNWLTVIAAGADGCYAAASNQRVITPKIATSNATKLYRAYVDNAEYIGTYELGYAPEGFRTYYRTSGIDDNTGSWIELPPGGDLSGATPGTHIQFMFELDVLGDVCISPRIYAVSCTYEDGSQDSHYQPSLTKSVAASRIIAWRQVAAWGTNIPNLQIRLYNAETGFLVLDDTVTASASGTFEYSTDGTNWLPWSASADLVGNYIRYTATTLPNNITIRALLTQA